MSVWGLMCVCSHVVVLLGACSPSACRKRIAQVSILSAFWIDCDLPAQLWHVLGVYVLCVALASVGVGALWYHLTYSLVLWRCLVYTGWGAKHWIVWEEKLNSLLFRKAKGGGSLRRIVIGLNSSLGCHVEHRAGVKGGAPLSGGGSASWKWVWPGNRFTCTHTHTTHTHPSE